MTERRPRPHLAWLITLAACLLASAALACGGGDDKDGGNAARNPTDPRRVPTATIPATPPSPLAALDGGQTAGRPALPESYVVKSGDTLGSIATELGISTDELARANPNIDPRGLRIGQELRIPRATPTPNPRATPSPGAAGRSPTPSPAASPSPGATPARSPATGASPTPPGSPTATRTAAPSPGASPAASGSPPAGGSTYTVQSGDTGCAIARRFMVSVQQLAAANGISVEALASLRVGQTLQIPRSTGADPGC